MKCFFCQNSINDNARRHIYTCAKKHGFLGSNGDIRYAQLCANHGSTFDEEMIRRYYLVEEWSLPDFQKQFGLSYTETQFLLRFYGIPARSISAAKKTARCQQKTEATCIARYGCPNPSSHDEIKLRRAETVMSRFGVDNVRKSAWFREYYAETMQQRYGTGALPNRYGRMQSYWDSRTKEEKLAHMQAAHVAYKFWYDGLSVEQRDAFNQRKARPMHMAGSSKLEDLVAATLRQLGIPHIRQFWVNRSSYDFWIQNTQLILEVQGDYWHANPTIYAPTALMRYPDRVLTAGERRAEDAAKHTNAIQYGFQVIELWESDIKANTENLANWLNERIYYYASQDKIHKARVEQIETV